MDNYIYICIHASCMFLFKSMIEHLLIDALFIFSTMSNDNMFSKKYFKEWNDTEQKWLLSTLCLPALTKNSTKEEKFHYFKWYNFNELLKSLMVDYVIKLNKGHLYNLDCISDIVKEIFPSMVQQLMY